MAINKNKNNEKEPCTHLNPSIKRELTRWYCNQMVLGKIKSVKNQERTSN